MKEIPELSFKVRLNLKRSLIGVLVASGLAFLITKCDIPKEDILKLYNEIRRVLPIGGEGFLRDLDDELNRKIIQDPKLLDYKVRREVDDAIRNYHDLELKNRQINMKNKVILKEIENSSYTWQQRLNVEGAIYYEFNKDNNKAQNLLGPTMGIRGVWVEPDPREVKE